MHGRYEGAVRRSKVLTHHHGCFNRPDLGKPSMLHDGYLLATTIPEMRLARRRITEVPFVMSTECQYQFSPAGMTDKSCKGCRHRTAKPA